MTGIEKMPYGTTAAGEAVELYRLTGATGASVDIITYGATVTALRVPDRNGALVDVVLGYDRLEDYERGDKYLGAVIGRFGNRIGGARFVLGGQEYRLCANDGANHLHGGKCGFDRRVWTASPEEGALVLRYHSPDGEEGYPGDLDVTVTYRLSDDNALSIEYEAHSDADTLCNLTNHSYFNLAGSGDILSHRIRLESDFYLPTDEGSIPTGEIAPVEGTPMDLRAAVPVGDHIDDGFAQLQYAGGYDHCWIVRGAAGELRPMAAVCSDQTGIRMTAYTTLPGVQFYAGNYLDGALPGKTGPDGQRRSNARRTGLCLESEFYPDCPNHPEFPSAVLRGGETCRTQTVYRFDVY